MNELVTAYRNEFPDDPQSDDAITLGFAKEFGIDSLQAYPGVILDLDRISKAEQTYNIVDYGKQAARSAVLGFSSGIASIPESIAIGARALNQRFPISEDVPLAEMPTYRAGQAIRSAGEAIAPEQVHGLQESFWASKVPQALGSSAAFMAGGVATKVLKVPGLVGIAGLGSMSGAVEGYEDAIRKGASEDDAFYSSFLNAAVGTTEALPLASILKRMDGWSGGTLKKAILKAGKETFEESLQEAFQGYAGNKIANTIVGYDKAREDFKDVLTNAEAGGVVGAVVSLLASAVGVKLGKSKGERPKESPKIDEVIPGLTTDKALATPPEIPNQDVIENYTGPISDERKELLARIAEQKILSGVDLSAGLPSEERNAVAVIEQVMRQAKAEQDSANEIARLQAMPVDELMAQRDMMVAQSFPKAAMDLVNQVITEKGGEQANAKGIREDSGQVQEGRVVESVSEIQGRTDLERPTPDQPGYTQEAQITVAPVPVTVLAPVAAEPAPVVPDMAALARVQAAEGMLEEEVSGPVQTTAEAELVPKTLVDVAGPDGKTYTFMYDGQQDFTGVVLDDGREAGIQNQFTPLEETPGLTKQSTTYQYRLDDLGYKVVGPKKQEQQAINAPTIAALSVTSLVDQIGFGSSVFKARPEETTAIGKKGGGAAVIQPAYHERMASGGYTPALADQLVQNARGEGGQGAQNTRRATAFENTETGEVVVLGTFQAGGKAVAVVNPDSKTGAGMPLEKFLALKGSDGTQLWTPLASMWFPETKNGFVQRFEDAVAYDRDISRPAKERLAALARGAIAVEEKMQAQGITAEGEVVERATPGKVQGLFFTVDIGIDEEFQDAMKDELVNAQTGKIPSDLAVSSIEEALLRTLLKNPRIGAEMAVSVSGELGKVPAFQRLSLAEQQRAVIRALSVSVYEDYKKGAFGETVFQQRSASQGSASSVRPDDLPQAGPEKLQAVAEDTAPGAGSSRGDTAEGEGVRYSAVTSATAGESRPLNAQEIDDFYYTLNGLAVNGVDTRIVQRLVDQLGNQLHGLYDNARKLVVLAVKDVRNPTRQNFLASLEEAFHAAFAGESEATKRRMEAAFAGLNQSFLTAPGVNVAQVQAEEVLAKLVADHLAAQGIQQPQNWAQRILSILKELYLKVALAIQHGLFGTQHTRQELAVAYMQSRLRRFLSGQNLHPSFLEFIGGGKPTRAVQAGFYTNPNGSGWVNEYFNWSTETLEYPEALEDSLAAVDYNHLAGVRYKAVEMVTDEVTSSLEPEEVAVKIATQNAVDLVYLKMFTEWAGLGRNTTNLTFDQWKAANLKVDPVSVIARQNAHMQANNRPIVPQGTLITGLPAEASRRRATNAARMILAKQRTNDSERRIAEQLTVDQNAVALPKNIIKLLDLLARYTSASVLAKQTADATAAMVKEFKSDISDIAKLSGKAGILKQVVAGIEDQLDEPIARQYESAIERMFKRFVTDTKGEKLVDLLETTAKLNIDWRNATAREIRDTLEVSAVANPRLAILTGKDFDSRALFAITVAFAKSNESVVEFLEMKLATSEAERTIINDALKLAILDTKDAIDKARAAMVGKIPRMSTLPGGAIPRLAVQADRLLTRLNEAKKENRRLIGESQIAKEFIDFHQDTMPVMASEMAKLETAIGAMSEMWDPVEGAEIPVAPSLNSTWDDVYKNRKKVGFTKTGITSADVRTWVAANKAWLSAQPVDERGANWAALDRATMKLEMIDTKLEHLVIKNNVFDRLFGDIADRLSQLGLPTARLAGNRVNRKNSLKYAHLPEANRIGVQFDALESMAMSAVGWNGTLDDFRRFFYHNAWGYIEKRKDLLARNQSSAQAVDQAKMALRSYLSGDPEVSVMITRPGAWEALIKYWDSATDNNAHVEKLQTSSEFGLKVRDDEAGIFRKAIGHPFFDKARRVRQGMGAVYHHMREAWGGTATLALNKATLADAYRQDPAGLKQSLTTRFTPEVWREFVQWLAKRPGRSLFYGPAVGGVNPMARFTKEAFDAATPGDAVEFSETLYQLEGGTSDMADFVGETLSTFQSFYSQLGAVYSEENQPANNAAPVPARVIGDARKSEDFPTQWMDYQLYGSQDMRSLVELLAFEAAYGRNMEGMEKDLSAAEAALLLQKREYLNMASEVAARTTAKGQSHRKYREALKVQAERVGGKGHLIRLEQADRNLLTLESQRDQFHLLIKAESGVAPEYRSWVEMIGTMAFSVVQRAGTAIVDLITPFEQPFRLLGISPPAFQMIKEEVKFGVSDTMAMFFQMFNTELHMQAEHAKRLTEIGYAAPDATMRLKDKVRSSMHAPVNTTFKNAYAQKIEAGLVRFARIIRTLLTTGVGRAKPGSLLSAPTFKPLAVFTMENELVHRAVPVGIWRVMETLVLKARDYYARNPSAAADIRNHRFTPRDLGYKKYFYGLVNGERAFNYMNESLGNFGMNLEALARNALANPGSPIFTKEQYQSLAAIGRQEVTLESDETNLPAAFFTNPWLFISKPLIGWGLGKFGSVLKGFRHPNGERDLKSVWAGILPYTAILPIGLAFAMIRDLWDEEVVGKKANIAGFGQGNDFSAMMDQLSRVGTFGAAAEVVNPFFNPDTTRPFSVDSRVFFVSSTLNMMRTLANWGRQGTATYATVYRPLASSLGGGGFLETVDVLNNLMSLDNAESRVVARINVNNYLRAVGRELRLDVMRSTGGPPLSNSIKPHVGNMLLSAYANDYASFRDAHEKAVNAAREEGKPDPEDHVKRSFSAYHPLKTVFRTSPSQAEYRGILAALNDRGRRDVSEAVDLYNRYAEVLGIKEFDGREDKAKARSAGVTSAEARMRAALGLSEEGIFAR